MRTRNKQVRRRSAGFTLIEILLVVTIIGILAALALPNFTGKMGKAQIQAALAGAASIGTAIDLYETDNGKLPESLQNLITKGSEPFWDGPYLKKVEGLKDPWGNEYQYSKQGNSYTVVSAGPDGNFGSGDDVK